MSLHASFNLLHIQQQQQQRRWRLRLPVMLIFLLVFDGFRLTISSSSSSSVDDNTEAKQKEDQNHQVIIQDAINKSRYHLENFTPEDSPYAFPNTRYRLAVMLESQLQQQNQSKQDQQQEDSVVWKECSRLYKEAAFNTTSPLETTFKRISSLYRSAEIILDNIIEEEPSLVEEAESLLWYALDVVSNGDGDDDEEEEDLAPLYATVFEKLVRRLLSKAATASQKVGNDDNDNNKSSSSYLEDALRVCDKCSELCPFEPVVDEYRGAILRQYHGTGRRGRSRRNTNTAFILDKKSPLLSSEESSSSSQSSFGLQNNVAVRGDDNDVAKEVYDAYENAVHKSNQVAMEVLIKYLPSFNKNKNKNKNKQNNVGYEYGSIPKKLKSKSSSKSDLRSSLLQVDEEKSIYIIDIWSRLIRHIILVACSAREAGLSKIEENHWKYGLEILSFVNNNDDDDKPLIQIPKVLQADFFTNVGIHYKKLSKSEKAIEYFQKALEVNPDDGHAIVQLASLEEAGGKGGQVDAVVQLDDSYVAGLFDGYSQRFEQELVEDLNYIGHKLVADALFEQSNWIDHNSSKTTAIKVIDIGCGTGLLGELLRIRLHDIIIKKEEAAELQETCSNAVPSSSEPTNTALSITGVDLSPRMADLSRARMIKIFNKDDDADQVVGVPVYDNVVVSDAVTYIQSIESNDISAITASDVFIYVGALEGIFQECSRALHIGGLLVFTIESPPPDSSSQGVKLLKSGRFGHTKKHIKQVANEFGFQLEKWEDAVLRTQGGIDVPGAVVVLSKK